MDGRVIIAVGLLGQMVPRAYSTFVEAYKREADPSFIQAFSVGSSSNNLDCKHGGCGGGVRFGFGESSPQGLGYNGGNREASPGYGHGYGKREALPCSGDSCSCAGICPGKREASSGVVYDRKRGHGHGYGKREALPCYSAVCHGKREASSGIAYEGKREASPKAQFTQEYNDAATFQNLDCSNPSTGCLVVSSNIPSLVGNNPVISIPQRVTSPPRKVVSSLPIGVSNPTRKVISNQQPSSISRSMVTNSPQSVIVDYQSASDECKCDFSQMVVFVGYDDYECWSISTTVDGSVCFYKNSSDEEKSCNCN